MRFSHRYLFLLCACLIQLSPDPASAAEKAGKVDGAMVVSAMIEAYGGKEAVAQVKNVLASGTIIETMRDQRGEYHRALVRPGKLLIQTYPELGGETRILDGDRGWHGRGTSLLPAHSMALQSMIYQYRYLDLPMGLLDGTAVVVGAEMTKFKNAPVLLLTVQVSGVPNLLVHVDPEKYLIIRVSCRFGMGDRDSELITEYNDHRKVGKLMFPFRLVNYVGDMKLSEITLSEVTINTDLPSNLFSFQLR